MRLKLIPRIIKEYHSISGINSKYKTSVKNITVLSVRCISNHNTPIESYLTADHVQRLYLRHNSKWSPNIVRSPEMNFPVPDGTLMENMWSRLEQWADRTALVCGVTGREITYDELQEMTRKIATSLLSTVGIRPGQTIAAILPNIVEFPPLVLAAMEAGIILSPINPSFTADEICGLLQDSGAIAAVTIPDRLSTLLEVVCKLNVPDFKIIVTPNMDGTNVESVPNNVFQYSDLVANNVKHNLLDSLKSKSVSLNDTVLILYSSGTSGKPKGVCITHKNVLTNHFNAGYLNYFRDTNNHQDVVPIFLPIFHCYGLSFILLRALYCGAKLILLPKFEEKTFLKSLENYEATVLFVVPPVVMYMTNSEAVTSKHLRSLRLIMCGAAPLAETDVRAFLKKAPSNIFIAQGYGLTETTALVFAVPAGAKDLPYSTVGPPAPNTLVKVTDLQTGQPLGCGEEGEICIKGPQVMKGYLNNPAATKECIDVEGWFHTGDVGYYDKNKCFYIIDRLKELIKVKGFQVAPAELEAALRDHPAVLEAAVIGVPHPTFGETPIGYIQTNEKDEKLLENQLRAYLNEKLTKYKHLSKYFFIDNIPKSPSGKILKNELRIVYNNYIKK